VNSESSREFFQSPSASPVQRFWSSHNVRKHAAAPKQGVALANPARGAAVQLVNRHISQRIKQGSPYENDNFDVSIEQYPSDVRVNRRFCVHRSVVVVVGLLTRFQMPQGGVWRSPVGMPFRNWFHSSV
jgi:hypothetical protein